MKLKEFLEEPCTKLWTYYINDSQGLTTAGAVNNTSLKSFGDLELCGFEYTLITSQEFRLRLHFCDNSRNVYLYSPPLSIDQWMPDRIKALIAMEAL